MEETKQKIKTTYEIKTLYRMTAIQVAVRQAPESQLHLYNNVTLLLNLPGMKERVKQKLGDEYEQVMKGIKKWQNLINYVEMWRFLLKKIGEEKNLTGIYDVDMPQLATLPAYKTLNNHISTAAQVIPSINADLFRVWLICVLETDLDRIHIPMHEITAAYANRAVSIEGKMRHAGMSTQDQPPGEE